MPAILLGLALLAAGPADIGPLPALAQSCYSTAQSRAAVQSGQVLPLSSLVGQIQAVAPGQIVSSQLCVVGGRLVYLLNVLVAGQVQQVQVDGASGSVSVSY